VPKLIHVQLNEVNFDVVKQYVERYPLPAFKQLLSRFSSFETYSEDRYEQLEPWIQWVSAHTGLTYAEHRVFRLGDIASTSLPQIFELLESRGLRVGALSPINARNELKHPAYFVPDPWTQTRSDGSAFSERFTRMLRQTVNDNSTQRISARSVATLCEAALRSLRFPGSGCLFSLIARSPGRPWIKALVLDQLIHLVHLMLLNRTRPDVSFVFLNAGAHIQHHYFFNSKLSHKAMRNPQWYVHPDVDPVHDMLKAYDRMLADYLAMEAQGCRVIVATGLTQVPYERVKFYYRLKDHAAFLSRLGIRFSNVLPRMTRDFEVTFQDAEAAQECKRRLQSLRMQRDGQGLFNEIEDRGESLFVTLTYPAEISEKDAAIDDGGVAVPYFGRQVAFVAIKNGMHSGKGFVFLSPGLAGKVPAEPMHVASLFRLTLDAAS